MSKHVPAVWYVCDKCNKSILWVFRVGHRLVCKDCQDTKKEQKSG